MKTRRNRLIAMLAVVSMTAGILAGCGGSGSSSSTESTESSESEASEESVDAEESSDTASTSPSVTLVYAEVNSADSQDGLVAAYFKEQVEELSGGSITIDIQASGVLGAEADVLDGMVTGSGTVDLARISIFDMSNYGGTSSTLMGLPYVFESREHYWNFTRTDAAQTILDEPSELGLGIKGMFYVEEGFRSFFFTDEVSGIEDIAGKKIRVSSDPIMVGIVESLGGSATVVSFNELYTSLQSGVVDGAEQPLVAYESNAFQEVAPYFLEDGHTFNASEVVMTESAWDSLTEEQQEALTEAGQRTSEYCEELSAQMEEECREELIEAGVTFIAVEDKSEWQAACEDIIAEYTEGNEELYQLILDAAN